MGIVFALVVALCWSSYNLVVRRARDEMDPGAGFFLTLCINAAANLAFTRLPLPGAGAAGLAPLPLLYFILAGLVTTLVGRWLFFRSVFTLGPSRSSAWKNAAPVYTLVMAALLLGEAITWRAALGVGVTLLGLTALVREQEHSLAAEPGAGSATARRQARAQRWGLVFAVASGLAFASGFLFRRAGLLVWPDAAWGSAIGAGAAVVVWLPFALYGGEARALLRARGPGLAWWALAGVLSSLAQLFTFMALRITPTAVVQVVASMEPVFTMLLSVLLLRRLENLNLRLLGGVAIICAGVALVVL